MDQERLVENMRIGLETGSFETYAGLARRFLKFVGSNPCVLNTQCARRAHLGKREVVNFLNHLRSRGCKGTYLRLVFMALKKLYKSSSLRWSFKKGDIPKRSPPYRPYMNVIEMRKILSATKRRISDQKGRFRMTRQRNYAMHRVAVIVGLRRNELRGINLGDFQPPQIYIRTSKGGDPRWRTLDKETIRAIERYLKLRGANDCPALFISSRRRRLAPGSMNYISKSSRERAGINKPRAGWHAIRRGWCTWLNDRRISESKITMLGGWQEGSRQPHDYICMVPTQLEREMARVHPFWKNPISKSKVGVEA